ncbi:MAG TPA: hypothetical protein VLD57_08845 [Blastocatellia bacterium]|nr:hypothetical protein [Blastocatellia bacterium]
MKIHKRLRTVFLLLLYIASSGWSLGQETRSPVVRLIRVEGSFGSDLPARIVLSGETAKALAALQGVKIYAESIGFLIRLQLRLAVTNTDAARTMSKLDYRVDIHDEKLKIVNRRLYFSEDVKIAPGETQTVSTNFAAVFPDRMLILLQITGARFRDGSTWVLPVECWLDEDFKTVSCKPR